MLWETEQMHGKVRRYTSPDEHPFFPHDVPPLILPEIKYAEVRSQGSSLSSLLEKELELPSNEQMLAYSCIQLWLEA